MSGRPRATAAAFVAGWALAASLAAQAGAPSIPPPPQSRVTDPVGFLSAPARDQLDRRLAAYERDTGHQVIVWIGPDAAGMPVEEFAARAFERWKVGRQGKDDGLVLFIFTQERKVKVEVGYDLEDRVTDLIASRVIREEMAPRLRAGDNDGAVAAAVTAILGAIDGDAAGRERPPPERRRERRPMGTLQKIVLGAIGIGVLLLLISNPSLAVWLLMNVLSSSSGSRHGGGGWSGGGGGGGWSGGGGRSGGGGATGSW
jgi:uncharacterized protein